MNVEKSRQVKSPFNDMKIFFLIIIILGFSIKSVKVLNIIKEGRGD